MSRDMVRHTFHGESVRTLADDHGEPWFILGDLCGLLGIQNVGNVLARLAEDQKGSIRLTDGTPGNPVRATVNESGMWTVVLRSDSPKAEPVRRWVTDEVLPSIRKTGSYALGAQTPEQRIALAVIEAQALLAQKDQQIAELTPPAAAWTALADGAGDYSLRDAAQILDRDPSIHTGQNRLGQYLRQVGWIDRKGIPYQNRVDQGLIRSRARSYKHPRTGEQMIGDPQVRITAKGLGKLHALLGGTEPLHTSQDVAA